MATLTGLQISDQLECASNFTSKKCRLQMLLEVDLWRLFWQIPGSWLAIIRNLPRQRESSLILWSTLWYLASWRGHPRRCIKHWHPCTYYQRVNMSQKLIPKNKLTHTDMSKIGTASSYLMNITKLRYQLFAIIWRLRWRANSRRTKCVLTRMGNLL